MLRNQDLHTTDHQTERFSENDIAIIGISGKFSNADNIEELWFNLKNNIDSIKKFPVNRLRDLIGHYENKEQFEQDASYSGGFLGEIDKFDASFFRIAPREAVLMEPVQRLFIGTAYEAIEDAGYGGKIGGTGTGIYLGLDTSSTQRKYLDLIKEPDALARVGSLHGILASRLSYALNLKGPCLIIDTACSSGLVALHTACMALKNKECDLAIAGGIHLNIFPDSSKLTEIESDNGIIKVFDKNSSGTIWGEGVGVIFLKPLAQAVRDRDNIHAVIKGSAINNSGASNGITAPNMEAQIEVISRAWENAGINPETVSYIEAHGTGTVLGDPIEIKALTTAFKKYTKKKQFCGIGSIKTNIGHTVGASGIASLIKVILSLKNKEVPAMLNFEEPNPFINFCNTPVFVNDTLRKWESGTAPRRAGVSAFGFSGTNCHVVLEEAPEIITASHGEKQDTLHLLTLSAKSHNVLKELLKKYYQALERGFEQQIEDLCYTANTGRGHYQFRIAFLFQSLADLREKILYSIYTEDLKQISTAFIYYGEHKVVLNNASKKESGEITEMERQQISKKANQIIQAMLDETMREVLPEICGLYVKGADIDWNKLYSNTDPKRLSLPVYPFERTRFWIDDQSTDKFRNNPLHPLMDRCLSDSLNEIVYLTEFEVKRHWVLSDHMIMNKNVIPGVTYLEMARKASQAYFKNELVEFKQVTFLNPLLVNKSEVKTVHTIIKKNKDYCEFMIASKSSLSSSENQWTIHVEGKIGRIIQNRDLKANLEIIRTRCNTKGDGVDLNEARWPFWFGPRWKNVKELLFGDKEVFGELELPEEFVRDLDQMALHPSLLDNAVNLFFTSVGDDTYLPLSYKSFKLHHPLPRNFYSHVRRKDQVRENPETAIFDITLTDKTGVVLTEVTDYTVKRVHQAETIFKELAEKESLFFKTGWMVKSLDNCNSLKKEGAILVFKGEWEITNALIQKMNNDGNEVIEVELGERYHKIDQRKYVITGSEANYQELFAELKSKKLAQIIHLFTLRTGNELQNVADLERAQEQGVYSLFHIVKAIKANRINDTIDLVLISDSIYEVTKNELQINPGHATLFGLGKVIGKEESKLLCRCIDITPDIKTSDLYSEIEAGFQTGCVAYRNGERFIEELQEVDSKEWNYPGAAIKNSGVYIITGGTGGIGLEIGKHLATKNNVNLALISRSKLPERDTWNDIYESGQTQKLCRMIGAIRDIEATGSNVVCDSADVANFMELKAIIENLRDKFGRINGIIHCAGVAGQGIVIRKEKPVFTQVLAPKVHGTFVLDQLTKDDDLDFFILCSSIASFLAEPGQGDYTAANCFLDSYAAYRNKTGKRTITINWPVWKETGMAVDFGVNSDDAIFKAIPTGRAMDAFDEILQKYTGELIIGELNFSWIQNNPEYPILPSALLKERIARKNKLIPIAHESQLTSGLSLYEVKLKGRDHEAEFTETEKKLAQIWGYVLGLKELNINDDFLELGGNSILAIKIEAEFEKNNIALNLSDIYDHKNIKELAFFMEHTHSAAQKFESVKPAEANQAINELSLGEIKHKSNFQNFNEIEPFNTVFFRSCLYGSLIPIINYFSDSLLPLLINDVLIYTYQNRDLKKAGIEYVSMNPMDNVLLEMGIKVKTSKHILQNMESNDHFKLIENELKESQFIKDMDIVIDTEEPYGSIVDDLIDSLLNNRMIIICVDCFYESIRLDTYQKTHWPHTLLIYGFDNFKKEFNVIEHKYRDNLTYKKQTISFDDVILSYEGYLVSFSNDIKGPTYFEFDFIGEGAGKSENKDDATEGDATDRYIVSFIDNTMIYKERIMDGLHELRALTEDLSKSVIHEDYLKENAEVLIDRLINIINARVLDDYRIKMMFNNKPDLLDHLKQAIDCWSTIRNIIGKLSYLSVFNPGKIATLLEKLTLVFDCEYQYHEKLFLFIEKLRQQYEN